MAARADPVHAFRAMWSKAALDRVVAAYAKVLPGASQVPHSLPRAPASPPADTPTLMTEEDDSSHLLSHALLPESHQLQHLLHDIPGRPHRHALILVRHELIAYRRRTRRYPRFHDRHARRGASFRLRSHAGFIGTEPGIALRNAARLPAPPQHANDPPAGDSSQERRVRVLTAPRHQRGSRGTERSTPLAASFAVGTGGRRGLLLASGDKHPQPGDKRRESRLCD